MSMEVLEAFACIAEIERKSDNLFRHGPADWISLSKLRSRMKTGYATS